MAKDAAAGSEGVYYFSKTSSAGGATSSTDTIISGGKGPTWVTEGITSLASYLPSLDCTDYPKMEVAVRKAAGPWDIELSSYVDDLHLNICIWDRIHAGLKMNSLLNEADKAVNRAAKENHLPLEESKHEKY